jgi:hypothetical protein
MPDKISKKTIQSIEDFERVALRALEAADRISFRLLLYGLALWHVYRYLMGQH